MRNNYYNGDFQTDRMGGGGGNKREGKNEENSEKWGERGEETRVRDKKERERQRERERERERESGQRSIYKFLSMPEPIFSNSSYGCQNQNGWIQSKNICDQINKEDAIDTAI